MTHASEILFMVNATDVTDLEPGQCFILAQPFGGTPLPCAKISQFRLSVYNFPNSSGPMDTNGPMYNTVSNYSWSTIPASANGEADLIT